ncbi:polysaccharide deacetylase family protein (plasmid) [Kitasatospora sp. NBC_00374]|uniref:polysaccharide deacetylase family protein n=1 Tax=Kitasatospora sp. NBC_00374 TaxID=2975964 RepID=UPI002F91A7DE
MPAQPIVVSVNYHRLGTVDAANPFHRLHTIPDDVFARHLDQMARRGAIVSPDQIRARELQDLNFLVCFDDVPTSAQRGIDLMRERALPVTVSVCGQLAEHGWGTRDKVYAIEKYAPEPQVQAHIRRHLPHLAAGHNPPSFYHLTKRADLDPAFVRDTLIDPLFTTVEDRARPYFQQRGYLSWEQIRALAQDPLVTIANHTRGHDNLAAMTPEAVRREIHDSHAHLARALGRPARYFTMPFGQFIPDLALDCLDPLIALGYEGILWVGRAGTVLRRPYRHQLLQLTRLHADTTEQGFTEQLDHAIHTAGDAAIWQVPAAPRRRPVTVVADSDAHRSCLLEQVMRQGKDYASDPDFYRYQFTDNPSKGRRPDYYAVQDTDRRLEATAYNFHATFTIEGHAVPGVYLSSWRKLPTAHPTAAAHLLHRMTASEPVVGVYDPNPDVHAAFRGWQQALVHRLTLPVPAQPPPPTCEVTESSDFPESAAALCEASTRAAGFTLQRTGTYQQWRHTSYPLARATYLLLQRHGTPLALAVLLRAGDIIAVADFHTRDPGQHPKLLIAVLAHARKTDAALVQWETSSRPLAELAAARHGATATTFRNFYHLNPTLLADHGVPDALTERWPRLPLHETATTSDVLLR